MMKFALSLFVFVGLIVIIGAPPVNEETPKSKLQDDKNDKSSDDVLSNLEYGRYLKEVVEILESDPDFKKTIENASVDDIKSGSIAEHLSLVKHHIRTRLDEAKQREMSRLRDLVHERIQSLNQRQRAALARADPNGRLMKEFLPQHIDHKNSETFGQLDLERLIRQAASDLDDIDRRREEEFKQYEMRKEYERRAKLARLNVEERQRLQRLHEEALEKKKKHEKVNHPGSVDQMEEVWEKVDHLDADQFTPKSFFQLHDVNSDGFLDEGEIEAIMLKEAQKIHDETPEADPVERQEEMDRMRQHVLKEFDSNSDRMLSLDEFLTGINGTGAKNDQGWKSIEDTTVFSDQDFQHFSEEFARRSTPIPLHQTPPAEIPVQAQVSPAAKQLPQGQPHQDQFPRKLPKVNNP